MFLQLKAIFGAMYMVSVILTIFVLVPFLRTGLDFSWPFDEFLVLDLCEHLGDRSVDKG